jgi:hypothetical protein
VAGSVKFETHYLSFPVTSAVTTQTPASGFALKSHALLCREYAKGRDWYDFLWYVSRKVVPELFLYHLERLSERLIGSASDPG